jgi:hypothetical protein
VALEPAARTTLLKNDDEIEFTESALSVERLIGKFVHDSGIDKGIGIPTKPGQWRAGRNEASARISASPSASLAALFARRATSHAQRDAGDAVERSRRTRRAAPERARRCTTPGSDEPRHLHVQRRSRPLAARADRDRLGLRGARPGQRGIANFFANLATPRRIANDLFQGKLDKAGDDLGAFASTPRSASSDSSIPRRPRASRRATRTSARRSASGAWPRVPISCCRSSARRARATRRAVVDSRLSPEFYFSSVVREPPVTTARA